MLRSFSSIAQSRRSSAVMRVVSLALRLERQGLGRLVGVPPAPWTSRPSDLRDLAVGEACEATVTAGRAAGDVRPEGAGCC
jgi:hypothetical protein